MSRLLHAAAWSGTDVEAQNGSCNGETCRGALWPPAKGLQPYETRASIAVT